MSGDSRALVVAGTIAATAPALLPDDIAAARRYAAASRAASTRRKYEKAWNAFATWCQAQGHQPLPAHPGVVAVMTPMSDRRADPLP